MSVRVDYRCAGCGGVHERVVASPPPAVAPCPACRTDARRVYSPLGVIGRAGPPAAPVGPGTGPGSGPGPAACLTHRDVPALCHLDPSVATAWIARARGDNRTLERELARQEAAASAASDAPTGPTGVGTSGPSHGAGPSRGPGHSHQTAPGHSHGSGAGGPAGQPEGP